MQILILEGHIPELKQDPILYVFFITCYYTCIAISRTVSQKESLILMHIIIKVSKIFSEISGMELTPGRKRTPKE